MTQTRAIAATLALTLTSAAGCGDAPVGEGPGGETAASPPAGTTLVIGPVDATTYEGAVVSVAVRERRGDDQLARPLVKYETQLAQLQRIRFQQLVAGTYVVTAQLRQCAGSCEALDPPSSRCRTTVQVPNASAISVRVTFDEKAKCRIVSRVR